MININLLPQEVKNQISQMKKTANIFSICLVVVIVVLVAGFLLREYNSQLMSANLKNIQDQITNAGKDFKSFEDSENQALFLNDRAQLAAQIEEKRPVWSQIMQELIASVPQTVQFVSLNADLVKKPNFVLQGTTNSEREIIKFKEKLESSTFFNNVAFKSSSTSAAAATPGAPATNQITFSLEFDLAKYSATGKETK